MQGRPGRNLEDLHNAMTASAQRRVVSGILQESVPSKFGSKIPPLHGVVWKGISIKIDPLTSAQISLSLLHKWT